ncbi:MAG: HD domain-containing protein [Lachnospiraceae bacterium]|nr:HD domain-containing protein [Lachnospiraceae bacterium]
MSTFYLVCFIIPILFLLWYISLGEQHSTQLTLLFCSVLVSNAGFYIISVAQNLPQAYIGIKMSYVGGVFLPLIMFLIICDICHVHIPKFVMTLMYCVQFVMFGLVCTIGILPVFYESVEIVNNGFYVTLAKEYGPLHIVPQIAQFIYLLAGMAIAAVSIGRKTVVSFKTVMSFLFAIIICISVYAFERILSLDIEFVPLAFIIETILAVIPLIKRNTYSINANAHDIFNDYTQVGYVTFDRKLRYMGCDDKALKIFPELLKYRLEYVLKDKGSDFTNVFLSVLKGCQKIKGRKILDTNVFPLGDKYYEYRIAPILKGHRRVGYIVEINDVTLREIYSKALEDEVSKKTEKIRVMKDKTMLGMAQMVESRDLSTGGHIRRTSIVVDILAKELLKRDMGFDEKFLKMVIRSAPMHDLGKIAVEDKVLRKQGKFTPEEYNEMKKHAAAGAEIVSKILTGIEDEEFVNIAINVAHYHHEKYNGSGYPEGLSGEDIPVEARIMAYADVFDALVSKRCYKEAFDYDKAFGIIEESVGTHFDPALFDAFMACRSELEEFYSSTSVLLEQQ